MFIVKAFNKNDVRQTYICDSYTVNARLKSIGMHTNRTGHTVNIDVGEIYRAVYIENPTGKTIDTFKYVEKDSGQYCYHKGFESFCNGQ